MKTVILCGGLGTRLGEETLLKPKPMVTIGGMPILWHIMSRYASFGQTDFILPLGFKGDVLKDFFLSYRSRRGDMRIDLATGRTEYIEGAVTPWSISLIDTGLDTLTGGRLHRLRDHLTGTGTFLVTYGDGVTDLNVNELLAFHRSHGKLATVTAVHPPARFGEIGLNGSQVIAFKEKPQTKTGWINGGYFVFEEKALEYVGKSDREVLEAAPLENLARDGQLMAFRHGGFWQCMDTMRDRDLLESLWGTGKAPWRCW